MGALHLIASLLDTHPLLWALDGDPQLPTWVADDITVDPSRFGVSDVTIWEIAIKRSTGKLRTPDDLPQVITDLGFTQVPITRRQAWAVQGLPLHHRDPFDRLLIEQSRDLQIPLVSCDPAFPRYDVTVLWELRP